VLRRWVSGVEVGAELDEAAQKDALVALAAAEEAAAAAEAQGRQYGAYAVAVKAEAAKLEAVLDSGKEAEEAQRELVLGLLAAHDVETKEAKERRREAEVHLLSAEARASSSHEAASEAAAQVASAVRELKAAQDRYETAQRARTEALGPVGEARVARDRVRCGHAMQEEDEAAARVVVARLVALEAPLKEEPEELGAPVVPQGKAEMKVAIDAFNKDARKGLKVCIEKGILGPRPLDVVSFLNAAHGLSATNVGEYFSRIIRDEFISEVFMLYVHGFDFTGVTLDTALRKFLAKFRLPGEAQIIDRIMEAFAQQFCGGNPEAFSHPDTAFILSFSIIMLNTDIHNPSIKPERKMTAEGFVRNNRGIDGGEDLPRAMLEEVYANIKREEIKMNADAQKYGEVRTFLAPEMEGWLAKQDTNSWSQGWQRRWFVVTDHCLYYFVKPEDPQMRSIIPLETGVTVKVLNQVDMTFLIARADGGQLKSAKLHTDGHMNIENRTEYVLQAGSLEELARWVEALQEEIAVQGTEEDDKRQKRKKVVKAISERSKHNAGGAELEY